MDDLTLNTAAPENMLTDLTDQSDEALRELIGEATAILDGRATTRRREAIAQIHILAKENGLTVNVKKPARKRGWPSKTGPVTKQKKESAPLARSGKAA